MKNFTKKIVLSFALLFMLGTAFGQATLPVATTTISKNALPTGFTHSGLDSDYGGPKLKFNSIGDELVLFFDTIAGELTFDLGTNNNFSGAFPTGYVFTVSESIDGATYTTLATYEAGDSKGTQTIASINATSRYVKWVYTTRPSGTNTALYNINLAAGISLYDTDSEITDPASQVTGTTISSLANDTGSAVEVFKFDFLDMASGDGVDTKVTNIHIVPKETTNTANWTDHIQGIVLNDGTSDLTPTSVTIDDNFIDIVLPSTALVVPDDGSKSLTMKVYLNTTGIVDQSVLSFMIDADAHGFLVDTSGSDFAPSINGGVDIESNDFIINVSYTQLQFTQQPSNSLINDVMSPAVIASITDANGNIDLEMDEVDVGLTTTGSFGGTATTTVSSVLGIATFDNLTFDALGSGLTLTTTDPEGWEWDNIASDTFDIINYLPCDTQIGATIKSESFEGSGNWNYAITPDTYNADSDVWAISTSIGSGGDAITSGSDGSSFWGMRDLKCPSNGESNAFQTLIFETLDISNYTNVVLSFDYYSHGYDGTDEIRYLVKFDDDTTWSGELDLSKNTNTWTTVSVNVPAGSQYVRLKLEAKQDGGSDWAGFDNIKLTGDTEATTTWDGAAWSNGLPTTTTKAIIANGYSADSFTACACEITSDGSLTIGAGKTIEIGNEIVNNGVITVEHEGSVVQYNPAATNTGTDGYLYY